MVSIGVSPALASDSGERYAPPAVDMARGNDQYRKWNPKKDPFAKNLPNRVTPPLPVEESARHKMVCYVDNGAAYKEKATVKG